MAFEFADQERSAQDWRKHIAAAALNVFRARGLVGAKTRAIAEEAGIKESLLWTYFDTKDEIFELAVLDVLERNVADLLGKIDFRGIEDEESRALVFAEIQAGALGIMQEISPLLGVAIFSRPDAGATFYTERLVPLFEQWHSKEDWADWPRLVEDWPTCFQVIWGAHFGVALDAYLSERDLDVTAAAGQTARLLNYGVLEQAARRPAKRIGRTRGGAKLKAVAPATTRYHTAGGVGTITLEPAADGKMAVGIVKSLNEDLDRAEDDGSVRVIVLAGAGAFPDGADPGLVVARISTLAKPVIARIAGPCTGAGAEIAAACDLAVMADEIHLAMRDISAKAPGSVFVISLSNGQA